MIELIDILPFDHLDDCKIHLASWNSEDNLLDVFVRDRSERVGQISEGVICGNRTAIGGLRANALTCPMFCLSIKLDSA